MKASRTYSSWASMKQRCNDKDFEGYRWYGAKGITYQKSWEKFSNFLKDMGERPLGTSLDRINPWGNYNKRNCRWLEERLQNRNKTVTVRVEYKGESKTIGDWADSLNMKYMILYNRLYTYKWPLERAMSKAVNRRSKGLKAHS